MRSPRYARISARLLATAPEAKIETTDARRTRAIDAIGSALATKTKRRIWRGWALASTAAVAAAALGYVTVQDGMRPAPTAAQEVTALVVSNGSGSGNAISDRSGTLPVGDAATLPQGGHLVAGASGGATVRLSSGTELSVEHDTNVEFEDAGPVQRFFLGQGVLHAKVAKLRREQRFIVRTSDTEVEVRGTVFRVEIVDPDAACADGARTRVTVSEGLVEVRGAGASTYVHPGESWPPGCTTAHSGLPESTHAAASSHSEAAARAPDAPGTPHVLGTQSTQNDSPAPAGPTARADKEASSVAQQNELFAQATAQSRSGDSQGALTSFETLLHRYPQSPLAESAAVQRMRLLESTNPSAAKNAARQYLARYPQGYARTDAARIAQP